MYEIWWVFPLDVLVSVHWYHCVLGCLLIKMDLWETILPDIIDKVHENLGWLLIRMDLWEIILLDIIDKVHENLGWLLIKMDLLDMSINDLESLEVSDKQVWLLYLTWSNRWIFMSCLQLKSCGPSAFRWKHIRHDDVMKLKPCTALLALCAVIGEFPTQRPVTRDFDDFFLSAPEQTVE